MYNSKSFERGKKEYIDIGEFKDFALFDEVLIENYKGILEYEEFFIRVCTHIGNININGFELKLNQISDESVSITGKIENLDFERR